MPETTGTIDYTSLVMQVGANREAIARQQVQIDEIKKALDKVATKAQLKGVHDQLNKKIDTVARQLNQKIDDEIRGIKEEIQGVRGEMREMEKRIDGEMREMEKRINERLNQHLENIKAVLQSFAKTRAEGE